MFLLVAYMQTNLLAYAQAHAYESALVLFLMREWQHNGFVLRLQIPVRWVCSRARQQTREHSCHTIKMIIAFGWYVQSCSLHWVQYSIFGRDIYAYAPNKLMQASLGLRWLFWEWSVRQFSDCMLHTLCIYHIEQSACAQISDCVFHVCWTFQLPAFFRIFGGKLQVFRCNLSWLIYGIWLLGCIFMYM